MAIECQAPACDYEFHNAVIDSTDAVLDGHEEAVWSFDRQAPDGIGVETLNFCSTECVDEWINGPGQTQ